MENVIVIDTRTWRQVTPDRQESFIPSEITEESIITKDEISKFYGAMLSKWLFKDPVLKVPGFDSEKGICPLKYLKFVHMRVSDDYIALNRYDEPIDWRKLMEYKKQ